MVKFIKNWNHKLDCDIFTTIRRSFPAKEKYYKSKIGKIEKITLNGEDKGNAVLLQVYSKKLKDIEPLLLLLDTGCENYNQIFKEFGLEENSDVLLMVYKKV